jgi:hypothetical protein
MRIECAIGVVNEGIEPSDTFTTHAQGRIGNVFAQASMEDIELVMHPATPVPDAVVDVGTAVTALDLHFAVARLIGTPAQGPVGTIALLLAHEYSFLRSMLGIMFDRGEPAIDDKNTAPAYMAVPRQGCAVFLNAIARERADADDRSAEEQFTAIHELGHVFNLAHTKALTYMKQSGAKVYDLTHVRFNDTQCDWLAQCSTSRAVMPGGTPFGVGGAAGAADPEGHFNASARPRAQATRSWGDLELVVSVSQPEFYLWEPVELNVTVRVKRDSSRVFRIPNMVDPGYGRFAIFAEDAAGERRRFRSAVQYCAHRDALRISKTEPYHRDVSIFRDASGYFFRRSGTHRLHAQFELPSGETLKSNVLDVNVLGNRLRGDAAGLRDRLTAPRARTVLLYKQDLHDGEGLEILGDALALLSPRHRLRRQLEYLYGRAALRRRAGAARTGDERLGEAGVAALRSALDSGKLTAHQTRRASAELQQTEAH